MVYLYIDIYKTRNIFQTLVYSETQYIEKYGIFKTQDMYDVKHLLWTVLWKHIPQYKLAAFSASWEKYHEVVTPVIVIICEKTMVREVARDRETLIYLLIYSNKLASLQLIAVLVYENSSTKSHKQYYINFQQKLWKISEFISTRYNVTKNEPFLRYLLRILFESFRGLLLPWNFYAFTEHFLVYL